MRLFRILCTINGANNSINATVKASAPPVRENLIRKLFGKYLLLTNTLSAGLLMVAGDLAAQEIEYRAKKKEKHGQVLQRIDWTRVGEWKVPTLN